MRIFKIIVIALSVATTQFFAWSALYFLFYADFGRAFSCIVATFFSALMGKAYTKACTQLTAEESLKLTTSASKRLKRATDKLLADIELCLRNGRDGKP